MKCDKLLQEANKQYKDMMASLDALKRGEISGSKANADIMRALDRVDELIKEYEELWECIYLSDFQIGYDEFLRLKKLVF